MAAGASKQDDEMLELMRLSLKSERHVRSYHQDDDDQDDDDDDFEQAVFADEVVAHKRLLGDSSGVGATMSSYAAARPRWAHVSLESDSDDDDNDDYDREEEDDEMRAASCAVDAGRFLPDYSGASRTTSGEKRRRRKRGRRRRGCCASRWPVLCTVCSMLLLCLLGALVLAIWLATRVFGDATHRALEQAGLAHVELQWQDLPAAILGTGAHDGRKSSNDTTAGLSSLVHAHDPSWSNDTRSSYVYAPPSPIASPYEPHPISILMRRARHEWDDKLARQSKDFAEAVQEYMRRYGRDPPLGFDRWYQYARDNNVQLIDEYDMIHAHVEPLRALPASELRSRARALTTGRRKPLHALIKVQGGAWQEPQGAAWRPAVIENWRALLGNISHLLPDLEIPVYLHDGPAISLDWEAKQGYLEAARLGEYVDESSLPIKGESAYTTRERECAPNSRFRRVREGVEPMYEPSHGPAFINSHVAAMDYCENPEYMQLHGGVSTVWGLDPLMPSFSMSRQNFNGDILWPAGIHYELNPEDELPFDEKPIHKVVWRGSLDGIDIHHDNAWRSSHRHRLIAMSNSNDTELDRSLRVTRTDFFGREWQDDVETNLAELNERYTNMRATGHPLQCDEDLCEYLNATTAWGDFLSLEDMSKHRFVMDVDGNSYSARFRSHLLSNQVPLKSTVFNGWWSDRIQPWLHYVPVRVDYSDLYDILAYFDGSVDEARTGSHDAEARVIAESGKAWAQAFWREQDMVAYTFRLLLEYSRLLADEREPQAPLR